MKDYRFSDNKDKKRYELDLEDGQVAFIEYINMPKDVIIFTHTDVPYEHENQGIGSQIAAKALEDVQKRDMKVIPQCGFIATYIRRHPEWRKIVATHENL